MDVADGSEATDVITPNEAAAAALAAAALAAAAEVSGQPENNVAATTEVCL